MFEHTSGLPLPMGATVLEGGVNFAIFSKNAASVRLNIYERENSESPVFSLELDPVQNKSGEVWHCFVSGIKEGYWYGYFIDGPYDPNAGHRFNPNKLLIDPYAKAINIPYELSLAEHFGFDKKSSIGDLSFSKQSSELVAPRACVVKDKGFQGKKHAETRFRDHIIYELHVRGFTMNPNSAVEHAGTFRGIIEKIPYLKELGVTAVELMPVHFFDDKNILRHGPKKQPLKNYWGYDPVAFSSLHSNYASDKTVRGAIDEFKQLVDELHKADIELFLDVVFNHTGEGNENGPTVSFRGIDNSVYYILDNGRYYKNYTGCGNTVNCNHPVVRDLIVDCLLHWVVEMGVDGFRFDLASILARDSDGSLLRKAPLIERIAEHPVLKDIIIIAEAWDAAGAYQVGEFGGVRWAEWNGKYRDDLRSYLKSDQGSLSAMAERITGSPAMFLSSAKPPESSINFITCHDGFSLYDLVSYNDKHNIDNGEDN
ncbi:MAG: glycogen-debranching protein, partial [Oligoflexia bacterium]|nr:glycogen-debranching protein [Oligoflexia bacterium]